jgi:hypothetical protein
MDKSPAMTGSARPRASGLLLAPFKWAAEPVAAVAAADPELQRHLLELDKPRMHLIALALAHHEDGLSPHLRQLLARGRTRDVATFVLGHFPSGLLGALGRLPGQVLSRSSYRRLVGLLADPVFMKILHHADTIDGRLLADLERLPSPLRRPAIVKAMAAHFGGAGVLVDALQFLAWRSPGADFDALTAQLSGLRKVVDVTAAIARIACELPLPEMPPQRVGNLVRIDSAAELRSLGQRFQNCLSDYAYQVDRGGKAVYLCDEAEPFVCALERHGRLGWFFEDAKKAKNVALPSEHLSAVVQAFASAGVPDQLVARGIEHVVCMWLARSRPGSQNDLAEIEADDDDEFLD